MRVLLTGANGFVGSHILESLLARKIPVSALLRSGSNRRFLTPTGEADIRTGSVTELDSIQKALSGVTHVIHCAGSTRACRNSDYHFTNHFGTKNVVTAINEAPSTIERLVHVSSLAATGPVTTERPAREDDPANPVSEYGKSKLAGEWEVRAHCRVPYTILRPPAVYGPRDTSFLPMFKAVKRHLLPSPTTTQILSLVFVQDLAEATVISMLDQRAAGKIYFVANRNLVTARQMARTIASQMKRWTVPCPLPNMFLWPICLAEELLAQVTGKPTLLNREKFKELRETGWTCDPSKLEHELGFQCPTGLDEGIRRTLDWYRLEGWV